MTASAEKGRELWKNFLKALVAMHRLEARGSSPELLQTAENALFLADEEFLEWRDSASEVDLELAMRDQG